MVGVESLFPCRKASGACGRDPRQERLHSRRGCFRTAKGGGQCRYIRTGCGFIQRDGCVVGIHPADVIPGFQGFLHHGVRLSGNGQQQGVKEVFVFNGDAGFRERLVQAFGFQVDFRADAFEAFLAVVYGVKGGQARPGAPGRCRCWRSPCRGEYAVPSFAGPGGRPGAPGYLWTCR